MNHTYSVCSQCHGVNKVNKDSAKSKKPVCGKCQAQLPMHSLVTEVSSEDFEKILRVSDQPVVVDFWASWCGPCRMYGPEFEKASSTEKEVTFLKINTEAHPELSAKLGIRGIPCTILFKNGKEFKRQSGAMSSAQVEQFIS